MNPATYKVASLNPSKIKWEYLGKIFDIFDPKMIAAMDSLGEECWELCSSSIVEEQLVCIFKRRK